VSRKKATAASLGDHRAMAAELAKVLAAMPENERIDALNDVRAVLHEVSPLKHHPVDFVRWVSAEMVRANDYNPNAVAPPEMRLLAHSVDANGYTMPIVGHEREDSVFEVVDGFHRRRVGTEIQSIRDTLHGRLPITQIRAERADRMARIAATVEHNRARGEHKVEAMSELVREMYQAGQSDEKIQEELGMDGDEVRRLKQITGLAELFASREFSRAWEPAE